MLKNKGGIVPTAVLTVICIITALLLAVTYSLTKDAIAEAALGETKVQMQALFPDADKFEAIDITALQEKDENLISAYSAKKGDEVVGILVQAQSKGYGGQLPILAGIKADKTLAGVKISNTVESPGIGKRVEEEDFQKQFEGMAADKGYSIEESETTTKIDGISGATFSSKAVAKALTSAVKAADELLK